MTMRIRAAAAFGLGDLAEAGDSRVGPHLIEAWPANRSDTECSVAIIRALNSIDTGHVVEVLLDAATHEDERVRQLAAMGLGDTKDPQATARLIRLLSDSSKSVQRIAIGSLAQKRQPNTVQALFNCIIDAAAEIRFAAADALKQQEPTQVRAVLERNARAKSAEARQAVVFLAGYFGPTELLLDGLRDESANVRKAAALGVAATANKDLGKHLAAALSDAHWSVRVAAAEGLRRLKAHNFLTDLHATLDDPHPVVRKAVHTAIEGLYKAATSSRIVQ